MHFEILVEDYSGKIALEMILPKILGPVGQGNSYRIISYKGSGRIPRNLRGTTDPPKRILLDRLPKMLKGYGKSLTNITAAVVVVVDLDNKNCRAFKDEMLNVLNSCNPKPTTLFRIAIEEGEAWLLGDVKAIKKAYPNAKDHTLESYNQDSICGTWEKLADAIYPNGSTRLRTMGWPHIGIAKCEWAEKIAPHLNPSSTVQKVKGLI